MMQPFTTMIKIVIFLNYTVLMSHIFLIRKRPKKPSSLPSNQRLLIWYLLYLHICSTCTRCLRERQRKANIQHKDWLSWAFRILIHVGQYPIWRKKKQSIFRIKRVDSWYGYPEAFKIAHARCFLCVFDRVVERGKYGTTCSLTSLIFRNIQVVHMRAQFMKKHRTYSFENMTWPKLRKQWHTT